MESIKKLLDSTKLVSMKISDNKTSMPPRMRISKRIYQILLILHCNCRASTGSVRKIQFFIWLLDNYELTEKLLNNNRKITEFISETIFFDTSILRVIFIGESQEILTRSKKRYKIHNQGQKIVKNIIENDLFSKERRILAKIGKSISEDTIRDMI